MAGLTSIALGTLLGAGLGAGKYALDKKASNAERARNAEANRYSVWTGQNYAMPQDPRLGSDLLQGLGMGAMAGSIFKGAPTIAAEAPIDTVRMAQEMPGVNESTWDLINKWKAGGA